MKTPRDPDALREAVRVRDLTPREMGLLVGVDEKTIRLVLAGGRLSPDRARRLARVLRRPVDELFADAERAAVVA